MDDELVGSLPPYKVPGSGDVWLFGVGRDHVEATDTSFVLEVLERVLLGDLDRINRWAGKLLLTFDGYESDSREVSEIREVKTFMRQLVTGFPYLIYFLLPTPIGLCGPLFLLMNNLKHHRNASGEVKLEVDVPELARELVRQWDAALLLLEPKGYEGDAGSETLRKLAERSMEDMQA